MWLNFFVLFCRMYRSHFYSPLMTLPHSLHVFTGKKNLKMSTFGMETEINKWCFIKIFSKNTIAPQLWTSSVSSTVWLADKLTIRTKKKERKKTVETSEDKTCDASVSFSVCHRDNCLKPVEKCNIHKRWKLLFSHILSAKHSDIVTYSYWSLYQHILHLWCIKGSL